MLRSMYSAISGMKNFQTKLDVIGNNIANVSTYGFKKGRVTFQDLLSQQVSGASAPTFNRGGVNPQQVGLGSKVASVDTVTEQGNLQTTNRSLDLAISGDGYFIVQDGFNQYFTRAGNFYLDSAGSLVNANGLRVMGYGVDDNGTIDPMGGLKPLQINDAFVNQPSTQSLTLTGNINLNHFSYDSTSRQYKLDTTKPITPVKFSAFDENGNEYEGNITFVDDPATATDEDGNSYISSLDATVEIDGQTQKVTISLNSDGTVKSVDLAAGVTDPLTFAVTDKQGGNHTISISKNNLDFSTLTMLKAPDTADVVGDVVTMDSFSIGSSGEIYGVLSDGSLQLLGQIVLSQFSNPGGLTKAGSNLFKASANSGTPVIGTAVDAGATIQPGALEMSNVDLSEEFTGMIEAQRGFQANARIITTSDQILQELVDLKR
ncbi:MAG: flagellar hook protein FlgE [Tuberibacillus sp.]